MNTALDELKTGIDAIETNSGGDLSNYRKYDDLAYTTGTKLTIGKHETGTSFVRPFTRGAHLIGTVLLTDGSGHAVETPFDVVFEPKYLINRV